MVVGVFKWYVLIVDFEPRVYNNFLESSIAICSIVSTAAPQFGSINSPNPAVWHTFRVREVNHPSSAWYMTSQRCPSLPEMNILPSLVASMHFIAIALTDTDISALYRVKVPSAADVSIPKRKNVELVHNASKYVIEGKNTPGRGGIRRTASKV